MDGLLISVKLISQHVAVAAIVNSNNEVLLSLRPQGVHQGGLWEFPGGKIEPGESTVEALTRELKEELGIKPQVYRPLIKVNHHYSDKSVLLDVWRVDAFDGIPSGCEGQKIEWVTLKNLPQVSFPAANVPIITALRLPTQYLITGEVGANIDHFCGRLEDALKDNIRLVQLRAEHLNPDVYRSVAVQSLRLCNKYGAQLLLNADPHWVLDVGAQGVHLNSRRLMELKKRPLDKRKWVAASCHNEQELWQAKKIDVDFVVLGPVNATQSHPDAKALGWEQFKKLANMVSVPVYALGGMHMVDITEAHSNGGQGIAAIGSLWPCPPQV